MLDTLQITTALEKKPFFLGVFPRDELPNVGGGGTCAFVINTDSSNLPGQHWIAVYLRKGRAFVFDSFGESPPLKLQNWLNNRGLEWTCNLRRVQSPESTLCGAYCIYFLCFITSYQLRDEHFDNVMRILFPPQHTFTNYASIVQNFIKVAYPDLILYL